MTRLVFVDDEMVMVLDADLPAAELVDLVQSGGWQAPAALGSAAQQPLRAVRIGRLVLVSPAQPHGETALDPALPALTLSPRQHQVLQGLADGLTTKEIALRLGLHQRTIELHFNAIKRRFGTTSRMQSVLRGVALGLCKIRPEPK